MVFYSTLYHSHNKNNLISIITCKNFRTKYELYEADTSSNVGQKVKHIVTIQGHQSLFQLPYTLPTLQNTTNISA